MHHCHYFSPHLKLNLLVTTSRVPVESIHCRKSSQNPPIGQKKSMEHRGQTERSLAQIDERTSRLSPNFVPEFPVPEFLKEIFLFL